MKSLKVKYFFLLILFVGLLLVSCSKAQNKTESTGKTRTNTLKSDKPVLLFDLSHREVFSPDDESPRGMKAAVRLLESSGFKVVENTEPFNAESLSSVNTVFIAGAMEELSKEEVAALKEFVNNGGNLLITIHVNFFVGSLLDSFDFMVTSSPISEEENTFHNNNKDFLVREIVEHPITEGISKISVMGAYGVKGKNDAVQELAFTSKNAWVDLNENGAKDNSDAVGKFCLVAAAEIGKGKVVVIGDDAVFSNMLMNGSENEFLLKNIVKWFIGEVGEGSV